MIGLSETLETGSTLVIPDITDLHKNALMADSLYQRFMDQNITLEFLESPWLNSYAVKLYLDKYKYETKRMIAEQIKLTVNWKESVNSIDGGDFSTVSSQASNVIKKNGI